MSERKEWKGNIKEYELQPFAAEQSIIFIIESIIADLFYKEHAKVIADKLNHLYHWHYN